MELLQKYTKEGKSNVGKVLHKIVMLMKSVTVSNMACRRASSGRAVSLQAWSGPEGSRKLRFPDFVTTAQDGGKVVTLTHRPPLPQEMLLVLISVRG